MDVVRQQHPAHGHAQSVAMYRARFGTDKRRQEAAGRVLAETTEEELSLLKTRHRSDDVIAHQVSPADASVNGSEPLQETVRVT